jgi:transposase
MRPFAEHTHFAGFDWASEHHDVVVVTPQGAVVEKLRFEDTAEGWHTFREKMRPFPCLAVAIETSTGPFVDRLLDAGCSVYPVHPASAKAYRQRKAPSGVKDDILDCWSLADALRTDGHAWRALKPEDPLVVELRLLCRDEVALIEERTAKVLQLRAALHDYFPAALEAFEDWTHPFTWAFIERYPTPEALRQAGKRSWEKFLHVHNLGHRSTYEKRLEIFARAEKFCGSKATTAAKSLLAVALAQVLRTLEANLQLYQDRIQELFNQHPDKAWFGSLPVPNGGKTAPRLLAELGTDTERFPTPNALQCHAGTSPIRFQSGNIMKAFFRRACNKHLRYAIHWFADLSRHKCPWAAAYYARKIEEGKTHACAIRCLGHRWLKVIWKMWTTKAPYKPELHQANQLKHGSWVLRMLPLTTPAQPVVTP